MPRVLHLTSNQGQIGGAEVSLARSVRATAPLGFESRVVVVVDGPEATGPGVERLRADGLDPVLVRMGSKADPRGWAAVRRAWRAFAPDVVHTHGERALLLRLGLDPLAGVHWVHTLHGWVSGGPSRAFSVAVARRLLGVAGRVVCVNEVQRASVPGVPDDRIRVVPNAGPDEPEDEGAAASAFRASLGWHEVDPLVVWVGRLAPEKDPHRAIEVGSRLATPSARLAVVGGGPLAADVTRAVRRFPRPASVAAVGPMLDPGPAFAAASVLLLTSRSEADPLVVAEAAVRGVPAVVPALPGIEAVVEDGRTGCVVPSRDAAALATAVDRLLADPVRRARLGEAARAAARGGSRSLAAHGATLAAVYRELLGPAVAQMG